MKYKVGDRVKYGSEICTVTKVLESQGKFKYRVQSDTWFDIVNEDEMIEGLAEEETKPEPKFKVGDSVEVLKSGNVYTISQMKFNGKEFVYTLSNNGSTVSCFSEEEIEFTEEDKYWCDIMSESDPTTYVLPQGYQFVDENGDVINATKIVLEKKKKEYPNNIYHCVRTLGLHSHPDDASKYKTELMHKLQNLLVCRDAYWKIAGEEMGLGKPWKPDWNTSEPKYVIAYTSRGIEKQWETTYYKTFAFPTEEMRDAFYENFKKEIETVKELL